KDMVNGIIHFNVVCSDLDRSLEFYRDMLGGRSVGDTRLAVAERGIDSTGPGIALGFEAAPEWRATFIQFGEEENATVIDLLQWIKPASYGKPYDRMNHVGIPRVALACDDIDKVYNDLKAKGACSPKRIK
ncbi:unnamed protein product, partial [marine sediment metagenome]